MKKLIAVIKVKIMFLKCRIIRWYWKWKYVIKQEYKTVNGQKYSISTVELICYEGKPYETMIFLDGDGREKYCNRYQTRAEAKAGHKYAIKNLERIINREEE